MRWSALTLFLSCLVVADASALRWSAIDSFDGLPADSVLTITEDPRGGVWAGTSQGLARLPRLRPGGTWQFVSPGRIVAAAIDDDGIAWAADAGARLHRFDPDGLPLGVIESTDPRVRITRLVADSRGGVIVAERSSAAFESGRLVRLRVENDEVIRETVRSSVDVAGLRLAPDGSVWWGVEPGAAPARLERLRDGSVDSFDLSLAGTRVLPTAIAPLASGGAVVGMSNGAALYVRDDGTVLAVPRDEPPSTGYLTAIEDARGRILLARSDEVDVFERQASDDPSRWRVRLISNANGLVGNAVFDILETRSAGLGDGIGTTGRELWFATDDGISIQGDQPWLTFRCGTGAFGDALCSSAGGANALFSVVAAPNGDAWFGSGAGLSVRRGDVVWEEFPARFAGGPLITGRVRDVLVLDDGSVLVATAQSVGGTELLEFAGLQLLRDGTWTTIGEASPEYRIWDLERDGSGRIWMATEAGLFELDLTQDPPLLVAQDTSQGLPWTRATALASRGDLVVVASREGLARREPGATTWTVLPIADAGLVGCRTDSQADEILALAIGVDAIAAAVSDGLLVVDDDALSLAGSTVLGPARGADCTILAIETESDGSWLLGTNDGLLRVSRDLERVARIRPVDGLPSSQVAALDRRGDEIWMGFAGDGAAVHRFESPETAITRGLPPLVTDLNAPLALEVAAIDPDDLTERLRIELRVDDGTWTDVGSGPALSFVASNFGLGQGEHTVSVRAVDPGGLVDLSPATSAFEIDVTPPAPIVSRPASGAPVRGVVDVVGRADDLRFARYRVDVQRQGTDETVVITDWTGVPVVDDALGRWDTRELEDDRWTLSLTVEDTLGVVGATRIPVLVDNEEPFAERTSPVEIDGARGGVVSSVDGAATLFVPALAVDGRATFTVERVDGSDPTFDLAGVDGVFTARPTLRLRVPEGSPATSIVRLEPTVERLGGTRESVDGVVELVVAIDRLGRFTLGEGRPSASADAGVLADFDVQPRYLQPRTGGFDGSVDIAFRLGRSASVRAVVYSRNGRARRVIADGRRFDAGDHVLRWDGRDDDGDTVATGLYVVHLEADGNERSQVIGVGRR